MNTPATALRLSPVFASIRQRVLAGEFLAGTMLNLGSDTVAEIAAYSGFDWLVIDLEHGMGEHESLVRQMRAIAGSPTVPLVRIAMNETARFKRVLDMGAAGVVIPLIRSASEARQAVAAMRYPPRGVRGVHKANRAVWFGEGWKDYYDHDLLTTMVQIETAEAVDESDGIAAIDGVDVLLVGPNDLSHALGLPGQFDHPRFQEAVTRVAVAARNAGKAAGIVATSLDRVALHRRQGYSVIAISSDGAVVAQGLKRVANDVRAQLRGIES